MPADIILNEDSIEVVDGKLTVRGGALDVHDLTGEAKLSVFGKVGALLTVRDRSAHTRITPQMVNSRTVHGSQTVSSPIGQFRDVEAGEINVGSDLSYAEQPNAGVVNIKKATGESSITLDGASGDIVLATVGSLIDKIQDLQRQIDELRA